MTPTPNERPIGDALSRARRQAGRVKRWMTGTRPTQTFAADYASWSARTGRSQPPEWIRSAPDRERTSTLAVVFHIYFVDLVDEFLDQLATIPVPFDLIVTNSSSSIVEIPESRLPRASTITVLASPNHGRDIYPFVSVLNAGMLDAAEVVLKVHTKKSQWRDTRTDLAGSGNDWKDAFLSELLGSAGNAKQILATLSEREEVGVITSTGSVLGPEYWGGDEPIARAILRRLGRELDPAALRFPAGSMYWARRAVLDDIRRMQLEASDFETEAGQVDGTTAHAVERCIGIVATAQGLSIEERSTMPAATNPAAWKTFLPS